MHKKAKNYAHLTDDEKEIINEIITICVAKIYHFVMTHNNPKKYANEILKLSEGLLPNLISHMV